MSVEDFISAWAQQAPKDPERFQDASAAHQCLRQLRQMGVAPTMQEVRNDRPGNIFFYLAGRLSKAKEEAQKKEQLEKARARYNALTPMQRQIVDDHYDRGGWFAGTVGIPGIGFCDDDQ